MRPRRLLTAFLAVSSLPALAGPPKVRIGVFGLLRPTELVIRPAGGSILLVLEAEKEQFVLEGTTSARLWLSGDSIECLSSAGRVSVPALRVTTRDGGEGEMVLAVPGKIERRFRGRLEVSVRQGAPLVVVVMDRETAVASAVAAESPPGAPLEALKAQAVVTRSYYAATRGQHADFAFCDTTHCQYLREPPPVDHAATMATAHTWGQVLAYRGRTFGALFSASCGGRTLAAAEVGLRSEVYPYFSVECPYCRRHAPRWETRLDARGVARRLARERTEGARLEIGRRLGWHIVPGNNYESRQEGSLLVLRGRGRGHGMGLCQEGAAGLAAAGANYREILRHYFPNTTILSAPK